MRGGLEHRRVHDAHHRNPAGSISTRLHRHSDLFTWPDDVGPVGDRLGTYGETTRPPGGGAAEEPGGPGARHAGQSRDSEFAGTVCDGSGDSRHGDGEWRGG